MVILLYEPPSLLEKRFTKTSVKNDNFISNIIISLQEILKPLSRKNAQNSLYMDKSKKLLLQAGYASTDEDVVKFDTKRLVNTLIVAAICAILLFVSFSVNTLLIAMLAVCTVYKLPEMQLRRKIKFRQKEFMKYLPDAVDLLSICVQAGLGLDASFQKVAD